MKLERLFLTKTNDLDLGWLLIAVLTLVGCGGFLWEIQKHGSATFEGWLFLSYSMTNLLIAAVPIAKARLLHTITDKDDPVTATPTEAANETDGK